MDFTQNDFDETFQMSHYLKKIDSIDRLYSDDLQNIRSKALWAVVALRFQTRPVLRNMGWQTKGTVLLGIKSFIECFETIK